MVSAAVRESASPVQVQELISFDLGNRFNAITDGTGILNYPSYCSHLGPRQDLDYSKDDFVNRQSFRVDIGAASYKVGDVAHMLGAKPTFGGDKWLLVQQFLFAGLAGLGIEPQAHVKELRATVPDDQDPAQRAPFERLAGQSWEFSVNGTRYAVRIDNVRIAPEGLFAWRRAIEDGLLGYPAHPNAVLDLGGGTAILRVVAPNGIIDREKELVLDGGTSALAAKIAGDLGLQGCEGAILDAIADGSFAVHAHNFKGIYEARLIEWVDQIRNDVATRLKASGNRVAQILLVGGSAPIFAPFVAGNPRWVVAPNPQFYGLEALHNA